MFGLLNLIFLGGMAIADVVLYLDQDYKIHSQDSVVELSMHRERYREDGNGKCKYTGYAMPIVRDWEIVDVRDGVEYRTPPNLVDTYGVAIVANKKVCEGKPVEDIFRTAVMVRAREGMTLYANWTTHAQDYYSTREDMRVQWIPQILERLKRKGETDPAALAALNSIQGSMTAVSEQRKAQAEAEQAKNAEAVQDAEKKATPVQDSATEPTQAQEQAPVQEPAQGA